MALFHYELAPIGDIVPWESSEGPVLSWFGLTFGRFHMVVGGAELFEYSDQILRHWGASAQDRIVDYQVAEFVREVLSSTQAALQPMPKLFQRLAADRELVTELLSPTTRSEPEICGYVHYEALRWVTGRSLYTGFLVAGPQIRFFRIGDEMLIQWDNRACEVDGIAVWSAQCGEFRLTVEELRAECMSLADSLLKEMEIRLREIEAGVAQSRASVDIQELWQEHEGWRKEFGQSSVPSAPDGAWSAAEDALRALANVRGIQL